MSRPRLLDLFCGAGGAAMGYHLAGLDVTGVDLHPQPQYPFAFIQADALDVLREDGREFDVIHASPPCQRYCAPSQYNRNRETYPDYVAPLRGLLEASGKPWVVENTPGAPLRNPVILCGTMFGLRVYRHRLFESNVPLVAPAHPKHSATCARNGYLPPPGGFFTVTGGKHSQAWMEAAREAMGVPWMRTIREVCEAIPPSYTLHVGAQMFAALQPRKAAA